MPPHVFAQLRSVGPATQRDLSLLGISTLEALAQADPLELYTRLQQLQGQPVDICMLDVFACAVAQARNPQLPQEECDWFWWSRERKKGMDKGAFSRFMRQGQGAAWAANSFGVTA